MTSGQGREGKREQSEWVVGMMQGSVRNRRACRGWRVAPASARACRKPRAVGAVLTLPLSPWGGPGGEVGAKARYT